MKLTIRKFELQPAMNNTVENSGQKPVNDRNYHLNFESWVKEVKPQLLAALKRRAEKSGC